MSEALPLGQKGYLRVMTPQTIDGTNLKYDAKNRVVEREDHLPLTARKHLERENDQLPAQLRHRIEEVSNEEKVVPGKGRKPGKGKAGEGDDE
jgi:hypothetical protein